MTPEREYLSAIQEKKQANQENRNGEFFWGFSQETAENQVVELCQKYNCLPSKELLQIAVDSINMGRKCSVQTLERNIKRALEHWARVAQWEKEAEAKWTKAEAEHDIILVIMEEIENNGFPTRLWEKHGKTRIYVNDCLGSSCGYVCVDGTGIKDCTETDGIVASILRDLGV